MRRRGIEVSAAKSRDTSLRRAARQAGFQPARKTVRRFSARPQARRGKPDQSVFSPLFCATEKGPPAAKAIQ